MTLIHSWGYTHPHHSGTTSWDALPTSTVMLEVSPVRSDLSLCRSLFPHKTLQNQVFISCEQTYLTTEEVIRTGPSQTHSHGTFSSVIIPTQSHCLPMCANIASTQHQFEQGWDDVDILVLSVWDAPRSFDWLCIYRGGPVNFCTSDHPIHELSTYEPLPPSPPPKDTIYGSENWFRVQQFT